ncbi:MAG: serine hydrolase [Thermomicrobiales bacterium]|nr:serine hydrolase [Thermomicrobiales bacterium]
MQTRTQDQNRFPAALVVALLLLVAIALSFYFSGSPNLRAGGAASDSADPASTSAAHLLSATEPPSESDAFNPSPAATLAPTATAQPDDPTLAVAIDALIDDRPGVYGIIVANQTTGTRYSANDDVPFLAASLYKLVLVADVYAGIDAGLLDPAMEITLQPDYFPGPDEPEDSYYPADFIGAVVPIDEVLFATGAYSSNVAAHALLALTDDSDLEATARSIGMTSTHFHVEPPDMAEWPPTNVAGTDPAILEEAIAFAEAQAVDGPIMLTTPRDIETYFTKLLAGEVVSPEVSEVILETLKSQAVDDRFPCLLPFETEMAHKTGNIDHVVHDVGVIWGADGPVILVAMIEDSSDDAEATLIIQRLALIAYGAEEVPSVADAYASPEISCGIVAPLLDETSTDEDIPEEEVPGEGE